MAGELKTKKAIERQFGCSYKAVQEWTSRHDFPGGSTGPWDAKAIESWLEKIGSPYASPARRGAGRQRVRANETEANAGRAHSVARALLEQEKVRKLKLQNDLAEGRLVDAAESERSWNRGMNRIRNRLEAIPAEIEVLLPEGIRREAKADMEAFVKQLLLEMASWDPAEA